MVVIESWMIGRIVVAVVVVVSQFFQSVLENH